MRNAILNLEPAVMPAERRRDNFSDTRDLIVRTKILSGVLGALIVAFIAVLWFSYPAWNDQRTAIADMFGRMTSAEGELGKVTASLPAFADRMDKLQASMKTNLQAARTQAQSTANQVGKRIRDDVNRSLQAIQTRMAGLESNQKESSERLNQLQLQVNELQREVASTREKASMPIPENQEVPQP